LVDVARRIYTQMRAVGDLPEVSRHPIKHPDIGRRRQGEQSTIGEEGEMDNPLPARETG
jgi:hypothetical protein